MNPPADIPEVSFLETVTGGVIVYTPGVVDRASIAAQFPVDGQWVVVRLADKCPTTR